MYLYLKNRQSIGNGIAMVASSPMRNDISGLGPGAQVEMQATAQVYLNQTSSSSSSSSLSWMSTSAGGGNMEMMMHSHHSMMPMPGGGMSMPGGGYDQLGGMMSGGGPTGHQAGFGSDEEDCFDQMSDQDGAGDDSVSSSGGHLDDTRIQQL